MREESTVLDPVIRMIGTRNVITRTNLPVGDYAANPYVGCTHGCIYCYANSKNILKDYDVNSEILSDKYLNDNKDIQERKIIVNEKINAFKL